MVFCGEQIFDQMEEFGRGLYYSAMGQFTLVKKQFKDAEIILLKSTFILKNEL